MEFLEGLHALIGRDEGPIAWWQMSARAVVLFGFGVALVRLAGKRVFGQWGAIDILLSIVIGSNLSRAMTGNAPFLPTLTATALLVALHAMLTALAVRLPALGPVLKGRPAQLVRNGRADPDAMRRHGVGDHDLEAALRGAGLTQCSDAAQVWIERNGDINVIRK